MFHASRTLSRRLLWLALMLVLVATAGCGWFRGKRTAAYELSPEERPLELPPDLDSPRANPQMVIPQVAGGRAPAAVGSTAPPTRPTSPASLAGFELDDEKDSAFRRIGLALGRIEGVELGTASALIGSQEVRYQGQAFLVRVEPAGNGVRVSAVTPEGSAIDSGPAAQLLAQLRQRLN